MPYREMLAAPRSCRAHFGETRDTHIIGRRHGQRPCAAGYGPFHFLNVMGNHDTTAALVDNEGREEFWPIKPGDSGKCFGAVFSMLQSICSCQLTAQPILL
jgi:hypothetical protein